MVNVYVLHMDVEPERIYGTEIMAFLPLFLSIGNKGVTSQYFYRKDDNYYNLQTLLVGLQIESHRWRAIGGEP